MIEKPADIIHHIIGEELDTVNLSVDSEGKQIAINAHSGWKMGFTVHKKINSKKLIEGIAKESRLFPFLKGNILSFNAIADIYSEFEEWEEGMAYGGKENFQIKDSDVISYKFDRTKIEDVKTKVILNYHLDYASDDFTKSTESNVQADTAEELFLNDPEDDTKNYKNSYYGIEEDNPDGTGGQGGDPIEVKYIRHDETAEKLQRFLLAWYCNQHNICKVKLPLSYLYAEIGDIVAFPKLLNGRKAYGEDYSLESLPDEIIDPTTGESLYLLRNGQQILPYWMIMGVSKTLEYVELDLIQMHLLDTMIPELAPIAVIYLPNGSTAVEGTNVDVKGDGSYDPPEYSPENSGGIDTYQWSASSEAIDFDVSTYANTWFIAPEVPQTTIFTLYLTVNDGEVDSQTTEYNITILNDDPEGDFDPDGGFIAFCRIVTTLSQTHLLIEYRSNVDTWVACIDPGSEQIGQNIILEASPSPTPTGHSINMSSLLEEYSGMFAIVIKSSPIPFQNASFHDVSNPFSTYNFVSGYDSGQFTLIHGYNHPQPLPPPPIDQ